MSTSGPAILIVSQLKRICRIDLEFVRPNMDHDETSPRRDAMLRASIIAITVFIASLPVLVRAEDKSKSLLTRIAEWQYPDSEMSGATMSDTATVNGNGDRTVPSIHCKTVLMTTAPIDTVVEYYKTKLAQKTNRTRKKEAAATASRTSGRAVTFHSDSDGRPVVIHVISINTDRTSTTLVISRAEGESKTHIAWSQYEWFDLSPRVSDAG
jgi:hypothetical protein